MVMASKFSNFPDELSENDELREFKLSRYDYNFILSTILNTFTLNREF